MFENVQTEKPGDRALCLIRQSSNQLFLGGAILGLSSLIPIINSPPNAPWQSVELVTYEIGKMSPGLQAPVTFTPVNRNSQSQVRVIGATEVSGPIGCSLGSNMPIMVPPVGKAAFELKIIGKTVSSIDLKQL